MRVLSLSSFWLPVLLATFVAAFFGALLSRRGRQLQRMVDDRALLQARLDRLQQENARLRAERDELLTSPEAIERIAREEYNYAAPGERVLEFESDGRKPRRSGVPQEQDAGIRILTYPWLELWLPAAVFVLSAVICLTWNLVAEYRRISR